MRSRKVSILTRREVLRRGAALGGLAFGATLLAACGAGQSATPTTTATTPQPTTESSAVTAVPPAPTAPAETPAATSTAASTVVPTTAAATAPALIHGSGTVNVMYAGSLVTLMEKRLGPAYNKATGFDFQGEGKGSVAIVNLIKGKAREPDIFISADPSVNSLLQGKANGDFVSWWVPFARTTMVVAWSPRSKFASAFVDAKAGKRTWESVLEEPGLRLGRTDPELDPKGYRTLWLFQLDEQRTKDTGEAERILGKSDNPSQIFPEEQLVARLQSGQLDAGIFYQIEAVEAKLPFLELPAEINQGDPAQTSNYATVSYTGNKGAVYHGSPILYTVTIPTTAKNVAGAEAFVQFLLSDAGQSVLSQEGLLSTSPVISGDSTAVPAVLRPFLKAP